jgi:hypothetical protein
MRLFENVNAQIIIDNAVGFCEFIIIILFLPVNQDGDSSDYPISTKLFGNSVAAITQRV